MRNRQPPIFWALVAFNLVMWLAVVPARLAGVL
jgi:hypothetical protein